MPKQACLYWSGVPRNNPLEGRSPWDFASIAPGKARSPVFYLIFLYFLFYFTTGWQCLNPTSGTITKVSASFRPSGRAYCDMQVLEPGASAAVLDFNNSTNPAVDGFQEFALANAVVPLARSFGVAEDYEYLRPLNQALSNRCLGSPFSSFFSRSTWLLTCAFLIVCKGPA